MTQEPISREEVGEAAATIRRLLDAVADGTITADSGHIARLEGAIEALGVLAARSRDPSG